MKFIILSHHKPVLVCVSALMSCLLILRLLAPASHTQDPGVLKQKSDNFPGQLNSNPRRTGINFDALLRTNQEPPVCSKGQVLVVLVTSAPWHSEQRAAIRNTWAKKRGQVTYSWQVLFLIGQRSEVGVSTEILQEQQAYGDILVGNYADSYRNLTLKVMHGLKWAADNCEPQFILKTDDDCFVNTDYLPRFLVEFNREKTGLYAGSLFAPGKRTVIRDPLSKWYVSWEDFRDQEYPPYASGIGYVLSTDAVRRILKAAEHVPPVPMEDAYVGILAKEASVHVISSDRFTKHNVNWRVCNYRYLMVIHHLNVGELKVAQENMIKARTACSQTKEITRWK
ncbi:beta-1,3-galactosyltransferase 5-like [Megalops cyprinoides]|uniref:beta-1,3-galactosyltransferase 5-like n=1 Tax=Megalops cyprinoides TaxID=118141 RepID=UPI0018642F85|nr:beta-1,3-galactosyltransferase 5-like [Megalops cyprinoides]